MRKTLLQTLFVLAGVFCLFSSAEAATTVNGILPGSATWTKAGSPYLVNQVEVPVGATLNIEPGVVVKLAGTIGLYSFGTINIGGDGESVIITTQMDDSFGGDSNNDGGATTPSKFDYCTIGVHTNATINIKNTRIYYGGCTPVYGQLHNLAGTLVVEDSLLTKSGQFGLLAANGTTTLRNTEVTENVIGVRYHRGTLTMEGNSIHDNTEYGMTNTNTAVPRVVVDARNTWWGDATGPLHTVTNPSGLGNRVSDYILYTPWKDCFNNCVSNVLFLPGIMGSRLYGDMGAGEEELWVSSSDAKQEYMEMNSDGTSKNDVYTKNDTSASDGGETGVVDTVYGSALYDSFLTDLEIWKNEGVYTDYAFMPYDWRLSLEDIVMNGRVDASGNLRYTTDNGDITQSYLYQKTKALQASSKSGQVTLIGHSNGGLVIKAFVQKLKDVGDSLFYDIDKIILVGVPQTGTPDSVVSMLYGSKIGIAWLGVSAERSRSLIHGMPTMYNLLPSEKLFGSLDAPIEFVGNNIDPAWTNRYGDKINTYGELRYFLVGAEGRSRPEYSDTFAPEVLRENLLSQAEVVHQTLDNWVPAPETEVVQIAGWGMYTVSGLRVVDEKICQFNANQLIDGRPVCYENKDGVTIEDKLTLNGDATVVVPSALDIPESGQVKKYWVDLRRSNEANNENILTEKKHKNFTEFDNLRLFIKSLVEGTGINYQYVADSEPGPLLDLVYTKYEIHSPLHLTVTDNDGKVTGWDSTTNTAVENISGAQYFEVGEIKTVLIPKDTSHTVRLTAYDQGSFTFTQQELNGEEILSETKFSAIPTLEGTVVDIIPRTTGAPLEMKIDFNADGEVETVLMAMSEEVTEYPNPVPEDTTAPEARIGYDTDAKDLVIASSEEDVVIRQSDNIYTLTDAAGNITKLTFAESRYKKDREEKEKRGFTLQSIQYNNEAPVILRDIQLKYVYKEGKRGTGARTFTSALRTSTQKLTAHYLKKKDQTYIMDKTEDDEADPETCERRGVKKVLPGLVVPYMETASGEINIKY